ncbi:MAG: hypothetical protein GQ474_01585 [Sulfurimonas sp.]|nr:hypothetical protein [Sulfurimonas sp.]
MSKVEIQLAVHTIGNLIHVDEKSVVEHITKCNKEKDYTANPISIIIDKGIVTDNSAEVGKVVDNLMLFGEEAITNALSVGEVQDVKKTIAEIGKYITESRKIITNPLRDITKGFTAHEAKFKPMNDKLTAQIDKMQEVEYKAREVEIRDYFEAHIRELELVDILSMEYFDDFIENKRKNQIFTSTGKLNKGIRTAIEEAVRLAYEPIKQAKEENVMKSLQSKQFHVYLDGIVAEGEDSLLEMSIVSLVRLKETAVELYPSIVEECIREIDNKISRCEANVRANKAVKERDEIVNMDGEVIEKLEAISVESQDMLMTVADLKELKDELKELYPKAQKTDTQERIKSLGISIGDRIGEAELHDLRGDDMVGQVEITEETSDITIYRVSIHDLEPLTYMEIKAGSQEEAKELLVQRFEMHLDMIDLAQGA